MTVFIEVFTYLLIFTDFLVNTEKGVVDWHYKNANHSNSLYVQFLTSFYVFTSILKTV